MHELRQAAEQQRIGEARRAIPEFKVQVEQLDQVTNGLHALLSFVEEQRRRINVEQETVERLSRERAELEPIILAQRQVIYQIFKIQEARATRDKWWNYGIGFLLGLISSMTASTVFFIIQRRTLGKEKS